MNDKEVSARRGLSGDRHVASERDSSLPLFGDGDDHHLEKKHDDSSHNEDLLDLLIMQRLNTARPNPISSPDENEKAKNDALRILDDPLGSKHRHPLPILPPQTRKPLAPKHRRSPQTSHPHRPCEGRDHRGPLARCGGIDDGGGSGSVVEEEGHGGCERVWDFSGGRSGAGEGGSGDGVRGGV